jgi:hypothetical protein
MVVFKKNQLDWMKKFIQISLTVGSESVDTFVNRDGEVE